MLMRLFILLGLVALIRASCIMRRTADMGEKDVVVVCFFVKDLKVEMAKVPDDVNVVAMIIVESQIPKVEVGVFERFGPTMERLEIQHSEVEDVEDHAFKGLTKLKVLNMRLNKLKEVRAGWMNDMVALTDVNMNSNQLSKVDKDVDVSKVVNVDVGDNQFNCVVMDMLNTMKNVKTLKVVMNPLSWKCMVELDDWMKSHPDVVGDFVSKDLSIERLLVNTRDCLKTVTDVNDEEAVGVCVDSKMTMVR
ncbi:leucine-rich repeat LGI family member 2-like [Leptopilina heterotoma]|uniref:leucine-rich repeat LGI family member 2-like n=1 Tax=Leptopilina heterotoma TaxID=63436 RepID=UPI001CA99B08|nr:leucine-rich repeat LGI family member 2-like [Leptopilina heterotoma]